MIIKHFKKCGISIPVDEISADKMIIKYFKKCGISIPVDEISTDKMIIKYFKKCGISIPVDGSEDSQIHIQGLEDYAVEDNIDRDPLSDDEKIAYSFTHGTSNQFQHSLLPVISHKIIPPCQM